MQILNINFNIPEPNNKQLDQMKSMLDKINKNLQIKKKTIITNKFSEEEYITLSKKVINVLDHLARLSEPAFNIQDEIRDLYMDRYSHSPNLGHSLFRGCCENLHKPYDKLKNRAFDLLETIDSVYIKINKTKYIPEIFSDYE